MEVETIELAGGGADVPSLEAEGGLLLDSVTGTGTGLPAEFVETDVDTRGADDSVCDGTSVVGACGPV